MTDLAKPVSRRCRDKFQHYGRRIIATLEPGDVLAMRLERSHVTYRAPISAIYFKMAQWHATAECERRALDKLTKRSIR